MIVGRDEQLAQLAARLDVPGLIVLSGPPGIGRSTLAAEAAARTGRAVASGGGLVLLRDAPLLPLVRAVRARLPENDPALAVEAIRARLGDAVLLLDDLQWADPATLRLVPVLREYATILACIRTPAPLLGPALADLSAGADLWIDLPPLGADAASSLAAAAADPQRVLAAAAGNPAVLTALSAGAAADSMTALVAELPQAERTALAALGLLGRAASRELLGAGADGLIRAGIAALSGGQVTARPHLLAEVAAGVVPAAQRIMMHSRLARLVSDAGEAARQHAAAGEAVQAAERAEAAASATTGLDGRADYLALAADQTPTRERKAAAAEAALAAGRADAVLRLLTGHDDAASAVLRARALLLRGDADAARSALAAAPSGPAYAAVLVEVESARDPAAACALGESLLAGYDAQPVRAAYGRALLAAGRSGWEEQLRAALGAFAPGRPEPTELRIAADLIEALRSRLRTVEAGALAERYGERSAGAYSWEVGFRAEALWAALHADGAYERAGRDAPALADRALPQRAHALLSATAALVLADGGSIPAARARLATAPPHPLTAWVRAEVAWLDGDVTTAAAVVEPLLHKENPARAVSAVTGRHCGLEVDAAGLPEPAASTVSTVDLASLADRWHRIMRREQVRCLLAGVTDPQSLLRAEELAESAGLVLLLGRARRALRRHGIVRDVAPTADVPALSPREYQTLQLVAEGLSSRRIAERLGLSTNTVETYIRSAMGKLGARTRTEAAVRAGQVRAS